MSPIVPSRPDGHMPSSNGLPSPSRRAPFPHIEDLTSVAVDIDPHTPLRRMLEIGDTHMRQATTYNDFRRPDLALQEYIKAFTIAVDKIPKHKDYPSLKNGRGDLARLYNALKMKITSHGEMFDRIKADIKEDNMRSGVQSRKSELALMDLPSVPSSIPSSIPSHAKPNGTNGTKIEHHRTRSGTNGMNGTNGVVKGPGDTSPGSTGKSRPPVHPKPQALHGNAIKSPGGVSEDLASRFARLRTQDLAKSPSKAVTVDTSVPTMPKMPDAIYSPARGTVTSEAANLPSSNRRGMFSRNNSIASVPCSRRSSMDTLVKPVTTEQFVTAHTHNNGLVQSPSPISSPRIQIPDGETMTPEELQEYMQKGSTLVRILLIDVRSREEFDEGHIMSQATICVEPAVLSRGNISAAEIAESMGIAPDEEMQAFEDRAKYDLVVVYDQDSKTIPPRPSSHSEQTTAIYTLHQALVYYNYGRELSNPPKLLAGGVDAWVDLFGPRSLQESKTSAAVGSPRKRRFDGSLKPRFDKRRRSRAETTALRPEQIKMFEESIQEDEAAVRSPNEIVRTTEDFLRRFPAPSEIQQSMTSPESPPLVHQSPFESQLPPPPPARPAPAVPRPSYSGLSSTDATFDGVYGKPAVAVAASNELRTGLDNPSTWCFANSLIQVLLASPGFVDEFKNEDWPTNWSTRHDLSKGPRQNPQLMARILGNLFQWMSKKQFKTMRATTLMRYCESIHKGYVLPGRSATVRFGQQSIQHDSSEFLGFLFDQLSEETNMANSPGSTPADTDDWASLSPPNANWEAWVDYTSRNASIIEKYWTSSIVRRRECDSCGDTRIVPSWNSFLPLNLPKGSTDIFADLQKTESLRDFECESCNPDNDASKKSETTATVRELLGRMPKLFCVQLIRFTSDGDKILDQFKIPFKQDFKDLSVKRRSPSEKTDINDGFRQPCVYDLYGVIVHRGAQASAGHYFSYVRVSDKGWVRCDDTRLSHVDNSSGQLENMLANNNGDGETPYLLFYKRRDVGPVYPWNAKST